MQLQGGRLPSGGVNDPGSGINLAISKESLQLGFYDIRAALVNSGSLLGSQLTYSELKSLAVAAAAGIVTSNVGALKARHRRLTGGIPEGAHAHHVFPQKFAEQFGRAGININDPRFGTWWEAGAHQRAASAYNAAWERFLQTNPSTGQILQFGREISGQYGLRIGF